MFYKRLRKQSNVTFRVWKNARLIVSLIKLVLSGQGVTACSHLKEHMLIDAQFISWYSNSECFIVLIYRKYIL